MGNVSGFEKELLCSWRHEAPGVGITDLPPTDMGHTPSPHLLISGEELKSVDVVCFLYGDGGVIMYLLKS